jgi:hypothetical protein
MPGLPGTKCQPIHWQSIRRITEPTIRSNGEFVKILFSKITLPTMANISDKVHPLLALQQHSDLQQQGL